MTAIVIVKSTPIDMEKLSRYSQAAAPTLAKHGGEFLLKGALDPLFGESAFSKGSAIAFPDKEAALAWYHSEEYQALLPLRTEAMECEFQLIA